MKQVGVLFVVFMLASMLLSACGAAGAAPAGFSKAQADIIITGTVESMDGTQWIVNGQTITVDPSVVRDGSFKVGDVIKVEGNVQSDGTVIVTRVEIPTPEDLATATALANDNTNDDNSNTSSINDANSNDGNINDDNGNDVNSNDDHGNDANSNGDNTNLSNTNDDNGNGSNSSDDTGSSNTNDNHGGNDNGSDDGGGSNDDNSNSNTNG